MVELTGSPLKSKQCVLHPFCWTMKWNSP
ncbi:hypothetical protein [Escherichia coli]|nr:hypothetical protein [Escherichia coli]MDK2522606.1 hypothetical protein [Escherichia coli]MDW4695959.1 hypothetical protein [Escherichia coli]